MRINRYISLLSYRSVGIYDTIYAAHIMIKYVQCDILNVDVMNAHVLIIHKK